MMRSDYPTRCSLKLLSPALAGERSGEGAGPPLREECHGTHECLDLGSMQGDIATEELVPLPLVVHDPDRRGAGGSARACLRRVLVGHRLCGLTGNLRIGDR